MEQGISKEIAKQSITMMMDNNGYKEFLSYFCEGLVLNEAIAKLGGTSPINSINPLANGMQKAISKLNPDLNTVDTLSVYTEIIKTLRAENIPSKFMKIAI